MRKKYKRKFREHAISVEGIKRYKVETGRIGNPRVTNLVEPTSYQMQGVEKGWTDVISSFPVFQQSLDKDHGTATMASSGGGGAKLHTTTTKTYDYRTLRCNVCVWVTEPGTTFWTILSKEASPSSFQTSTALRWSQWIQAAAWWS